MEHTPFPWPIRIYYEDTDAGGVVYHASYLRFFERARTEYLRNVGFTLEGVASQGILFLLRRAEVDYLKPARLDDRIQVWTEIKRFGRVYLIFAQSAVSMTEPEMVFCRALFKVASVETGTFKPCPLPNILRDHGH